MFAAVILTLLGTLNMFQGFVALFDDGFFVAQTRTSCCSSTTAPGAWSCSLGPAARRGGARSRSRTSWARWFAVLVAFINVIAQIGFLSAYPIWSAIMILLDILVIFALTARWDEARAAM